jgi:hypothetical protein
MVIRYSVIKACRLYVQFTAVTHTEFTNITHNGSYDDISKDNNYTE